MNHGSLFSGIGGFDLAAEWMGWNNVFQVEWDEWCRKVLAKNFPNSLRFGDIVEFNKRLQDGKIKIPSIDIITGGFPCQPFSHAGKRKGTDDSRYLWPEMLTTIRELKPAYVVGENVAGLLSMEDGKTLERIFLDLEDAGYTVESFIIPACGVGAWHRRDRIWIVAYCESIRSGGLRNESKKEGTRNSLELSGELRGVFPDTISQRGCSRNAGGENAKDVRKSSRDTQHGYWDSEPDVGRVAHGIPNRVDRLKGLGNAIVPRVAYEIFKAIEAIKKA